jgi:hypothetical protein
LPGIIGADETEGYHITRQGVFGMARYRFIEAITSLLALLARTPQCDSPVKAAEAERETASSSIVVTPQRIRVQGECRALQPTGPVRRRLSSGAKHIVWNRNERYSDYGTKN